MRFFVDTLSFYLIEQVEENSKHVKLTKVLSHDEYEKSELKDFLHDELKKIAKRKVEFTPKSEGAPTKIGQFIVEEGHPLDSNPNYAMFQRLLQADGKESFKEASQPIVQSYLKTPGVRGGVLLLLRMQLEKYDDRYVILLKCDFEQKTAIITDESSLISNVEMAINAKNLKSIMYPYMIEPGMNEYSQVKIHQFSHARYFEELLKFVEYPQSVHDIVTQEVLYLAKQHIEQIYPEDTPERQAEEETLELLAAKPKRELTERWDHETVMEAAHIITERQPEVDLRCKLDHIQIKAMLSDYGVQVHIAEVNNRYVVVLEGDMLQFEKGFSPVEFLKPKPLREVVQEIENRPSYSESQPDDLSFAQREVAVTREEDDNPPW